MSEARDPLLLDHEYDGIRELDNQLLRWWVWLFNLTILFSGLYLLYYHVLGWGKLSAEEYAEEMRVGGRSSRRRWHGLRRRWRRLRPPGIRRCWRRGGSFF